MKTAQDATSEVPTATCMYTDHENRKTELIFSYLNEIVEYFIKILRDKTN